MTAMSMPYVNDFVTKLVRLQQDGKEAISGPVNWLTPPLLEVATESGQTLTEITDAMATQRGHTDRGRWHWLIGSPGNGKSAKLGQIARSLLEAGFEIEDKDGVSIKQPTSDDWLPYLLEVREAGERYSSAYLVQDASVVRHPFDSDCNPAKDLREILREAWTRGLSLILCTNWGVLQRLFDEGHTDPAIRGESWFRAVKGAVSASNQTSSIPTGDGRTVFDEIKVTYEYLDNRSLLVGNDTFEQLLDKATEQSRWKACAGCPSRSLCPMRANRDDLSSGDISRHMVDTLRRAEALSGQTIVFREAVALVSLFLAGCPNDHGGRMPCEWVHDQVREGKDFNLLARRLPMLLFGSSRPYGLTGHGGHVASANAVKREELSSLKAVRELLDRSSAVRRALTPVICGGEISSDVGVERLVGPDGAVTKLDPSLDPRHARVPDEFLAKVSSGTPLSELGLIEYRCLEHWDEMFKAAEAGQISSQGSEVFFWLRRWQTTCLAWMAATSSGRNALRPELDAYLKFCDTSGEPNSRRAEVLHLERTLEQILAPDPASENGALHIKLSESMSLAGRWAEHELRPRLQQYDKRHGIVLRIKIGDVHTFVVSAETFGWLWRRLHLWLSDVSFKPDVLSALRRTRAQAAAASHYSVQDDDVTIIVTDEQKKKRRLVRTQGELVPMSIG